MAYTITSDISRSIAAKQKEYFYNSYETWPVEYPALCTEMTGVKETETFDTMGNLGAAYVKTEGDPLTYKSIAQAYQTSVKSQTVGNGFAFTVESMKFDLNGCLDTAKSKELIRTMRDYEEQTVITRYDNAFATDTLSNGVFKCSDSVPCKDAPGTLNDTLATASSLSDPDNHQAMLQMFTQFKNHQGKPMPSYATDGMTHALNQFAIQEVYAPGKKPAETSNTTNVLPGAGITWHYSHYLSDTNAWFMWDKKFIHAILVWWMKTQFTDEIDFDTKNLKLAAMAMFNSCMTTNVGFVGNVGA